jgi:hypothetical protein
VVIKNAAVFNYWRPAGFDGLFHWDFLKPALSGKITPMDIDCVIEHRGDVLMFETKRPGKKIELGQRLTLTTMWRMGCSIIHLEGKSPKEIEAACFYDGKSFDSTEFGLRPLKSCDAEDVLFTTAWWFSRSEGGKLTREEWQKGRKEITDWIESYNSVQRSIWPEYND